MQLPIGRRVVYIMVGVVIAAGLLYAYVDGALRQARVVNTDLTAVDQRAYMNYARKLAVSNYTHVGGRNRMPIYPILQSFLYEPSLSMNAFFNRGKLLNIGLSVALLIGIFFLLRQYLPTFATLNLWTITAFLVFIFKAGYFQTELLFYFLNFCSFLAMNAMLHRPRWQLGLLTGFLIGVTHLTKASVLPGLMLFLLTAGVKEAVRFYRARWRAQRAEEGTGEASLRRLMSLACVGVLFLVTVSPYIITSKRVFGRYFYNVNSTFYMWYDSWEEAKQGTRAHGDREGWPDMPADEIPSLRKYLREHTWKQIGGRIVNGFKDLFESSRESYGYLKYVFIYLGFGGFLLVLQYRKAIGLLKRHLSLWVFGGLYFACYFLLYAWYTPITTGVRLPLAQFLPLMFSAAFVIYRLVPKDLEIVSLGWRASLAQLFSIALLPLIAYDVYQVLTERIVELYGGW